MVVRNIATSREKEGAHHIEETQHEIVRGLCGLGRRAKGILHLQTTRLVGQEPFAVGINKGHFGGIVD